jgi:predicted metalloprotease
VIAHEIGHHVQKQLGYSDRVRTRKGRLSDSVRLELQADYLAGVWAYHAQKKWNILQPGDLEAGLTAANAIGDDRLQKQARGYVVPDSFTHGTSEQRVKYFRQGFETGDVSREKLDFFFEAPEL